MVTSASALLLPALGPVALFDTTAEFWVPMIIGMYRRKSPRIAGMLVEQRLSQQKIW